MEKLNKPAAATIAEPWSSFKASEFPVTNENKRLLIPWFQFENFSKAIDEVGKNSWCKYVLLNTKIKFILNSNIFGVK